MILKFVLIWLALWMEKRRLSLQPSIISKIELMTKHTKDIEFHTDREVALKEFPNKFFAKHWDDDRNTDYIIIENKKYYIDYKNGCVNERT